MSTVPQQLEDVATAIEQLRTATDPVARVQAVRAAADAVGGLSQADRQRLAHGLLAHGAPVAGRVLDEYDGGRVPPDVLLAVAQDLLALAPIETERIAGELRDAARFEAATGRGDTPGRRPAARPAAVTERERVVPVPVATGASERVGETNTSTPVVAAPPPVPETARRRSLREAGARARTTVADPAFAVSSWRAAVRRPPSLADRVRAQPGARARLDYLTVLTAGGTPLDGPAVLELLQAFPDGWQRRAALRRLIAGPDADLGSNPVAVVELFEREGDRFAVAARLVRDAGVGADRVQPALTPAAAERLQARSKRGAGAQQA
jgi:hypothetical protein